MDIDLLNLFRIINHGGVVQAPQEGMDEATYNAMAFAQANDYTQFADSFEAICAGWEMQCELVAQFGLTDCFF